MKYILLLVLSTNLWAQENQKVIYGEDNRVDLVDSNNADYKRLARSTVALVKNIRTSGGQYLVDETTLGDTYGLCADEPFRNQPAAAFCSGFLVAPNKVMTAGHCINSTHDCSQVSFVFDYAKTAKGNIRTKFSENQVYRCKTILGRTLEGGGLDFAVIELDRDVVGREPVKLADNSNLQRGTNLVVIGHPSGLPTKIADGSYVKSIEESLGFFRANLDTYGGNSGSAIFNTSTLEVEGILVRGAKDYVQDGSCVRSNFLSEHEGSGESATLISRVLENGFEDEPTSPTQNSGETRYLWLDYDMTCNEFRGNEYVREVADAYCGRGDSTDNEIRYIWLDSDMTCNEFRGPEYIREVPNSYCGRGSSSGEPLRYVYLDSDNNCNEFRGSNYIREVAMSYCY